jgi:type IV pilus assembly protein PilQ
VITRVLLLAFAALVLGAVPVHAQSAGCRAGGAGCITVTFDDTRMADVAAKFAEFSGTSIVLAPGIDGRVTAEIRNQPWEVALRVILESQGLAARRVAPTLLRVDAIGRAATQGEAAPLVTRVIRINYVPAASIAATLASVRTERGRIAVSTETNAIVVTDTEEAIARMVELIGHP